ncbi:MAG: Rne/Rng family ribonuclease [Rikenellaceae bacterium]|jgi:ribonuclease G|nr:Rne/Rng family ribonuclease [Rikenellaceae bacterium]
MNKELVIHVTPSEIDIALVEDKLLVEYSSEMSQSGYAVGDLYLGKVKKIMTGLNAAFVNIGHEKDAFIHYLDLGAQFLTLQKAVNSQKPRKPKFENLPLEQPLKRDGKIAQVLAPGQNILVQIAKEAISTKGPRLTSDISLAGRTVVLMPLTNKVTISQKIKSNAERKRLKQIAEEVLPKNYGVIIRTAAQGKEADDLRQEITALVQKWDQVYRKGTSETPPALLASEINRTTAILRDLLSVSFSTIHVDDEAVYEEIKEYVRSIEPEKEKIVKLYKGSVPIFDNFDITRQIKSSFGQTISFKRGAYMIIEHTEALHVIDINSGKRSKTADNQEETAVEVNMNAAPEIARQLRLRDMGGIIVIDFIDMHKSANRQMLYERMREAMSTDRARHTILPLSKFGLMQITRQRVRPATEIDIAEVCPTCGGTGKIHSSVLFEEKLEGMVATQAKEHGQKRLVLHVHPFVASYLTKGLFSIRKKWAMKYRVKLQVIPDMSVGYIDAKFFDPDGEELV